MKKYIILVAAAVAALASCTKSEINSVDREINFQVANYMARTKAATGVLYDNGAFGTYAWFNSTDDFMVNEQIDLIGGVWKNKDNTFYWPKTGSIDFISYSPFEGTSNTAGTTPAVTKEKITYTGVTAGTTDLMYADKVTVACASGAGTNEINDGVDSGYKGVPTLFHHALAKLSFQIKANFVEWDDATTGSHTEWKVTVTSAKISGFKTTGNCELNWSGSEWTKPVTTVGGVDYNVWTSLSGATAEQELVDPTTYPTGVVLTTSAQTLNAASGYVIPQVLEAAAQKITLAIHIKTTLSNGKTIEEDLNPTIDLTEISSLKAWQMNQNILYTISIKPTAKATDGSGSDENPEDVIITFDPATADWDSVAATATIQL